jgi:hypothetical protein
MLFPCVLSLSKIPHYVRDDSPFVISSAARNLDAND